MSVNSEEGLKRVIGVKSLTVNAVNLTIGAGIFALPAVVALHLGASAYWAYIICTVLLCLVLLCFIEVGSKISSSGGAYAYIEAAFGPYAGFLANSLFWLGFTTMATAAVANVMADNLAVFFPILHQYIFRVIFFALIFGGLIILNIRGSKESSGFVFVITLMKLLPLLILIAFGFSAIQGKNLIATENLTLTNLGQGALILFFAFGGGAETALSASGEIKDPKRTIPRGLLYGVLIVFLIYLSIQLVAQGVLGNELANQQEAPLAAVAEKLFGPFGVVFIVAAATFSCFGLISGDILAASRLPYAAAKDGLLPSFLAKIHPNYSTPHHSILLYGTVIFLFSISGSFKELAILSSASILLIYVGVIAATIKLRNWKVENSFSNPGGITIPILALLATLWFLSNLSLIEFVAVAIFLVLITAIYMLMKRRKRSS
jgi:basic amino acid/polyamine antiporter, APA family